MLRREGRFLDAWCRSAMRSRLEPIKKVAHSLRAHRELILNWFCAKKQYNKGIVDGMKHDDANCPRLQLERRRCCKG